MNDKNMHNRVRALADAHAELPLHQRNLKLQLMATHSRQHGSQNWFVSTFVIPFKELTNTMQTKAKIASLAGLATMAVVAAFTVVSLTAPNPVSAAQQQLQETKAAVQQLSEQETAALKQRVDANLAKRLDEGLQAQDARIISAEEFQRITALDPDVKLAGAKITSYVAFTNDDSQKVIIVVGENDHPILLMTDSGKGWTSPSIEALTK